MYDFWLEKWTKIIQADIFILAAGIPCPALAGRG